MYRDRFERWAITLSGNRRETVERNIALTGQVTKYIMAHPQLLESLPEKFELVVLPNDDPDLQAYNLELHDQYQCRHTRCLCPPQFKPEWG
ncbi:MAG: DUF5647 family protein [Caldilineaceae bacterium]